MIPTDPDDRDALAGEYVLGTLGPATTLEVEAALVTDADLARRVLFWETRLLPAAEAAVAPLGVPGALWDRIETGLAVTAQPGAGRRTSRRLWDNAPFWRATTGLAAAAAILLAVVPVLRRDLPEAPPPRFYALLQARDAAGGETGPGWLIQIAQDGTVRSIPLGLTEPGEGRALQLWTLWDAARGPVSLGVLPPGGAVRLPPDRLPQIGGGQLFEITLEPGAGSPTGRPTGRILFIGRAAAAPTQAL